MLRRVVIASVALAVACCPLSAQKVMAPSALDSAYLTLSCFYPTERVPAVIATMRAFNALAGGAFAARKRAP
jgi:hypothetical protein